MAVRSPYWIARIGSIDNRFRKNRGKRGKRRETVPNVTLPELELDIIVRINVETISILSPSNILLILAVILLGPVLLNKFVVIVASPVARITLVNKILTNEVLSILTIAAEPEIEYKPVTIRGTSLLPSTVSLLESALVICNTEVSKGTSVSVIEIILSSIMEPIIEDKELLENLGTTEALLLKITICNIRTCLLITLDLGNLDTNSLVHGAVPVMIGKTVVIISVTSEILPLIVIIFSNKTSIISIEDSKSFTVKCSLNRLIGILLKIRNTRN